MIVSLFVGVWVARYLGPSQFGLLSYVQAFVGLFFIFSTLGLDGIVVRDIIKNENDRDLLLGSAFVLKLIGSIFLIVISLGFGLINKEPKENIYLILILSFTSIFQSLNVIDFYFQSKVISKYSVYANFIVLMISSILKIFLILFGFSLIYFVLLFLFDAIILAVCLIIFYKKNQLKVIKWRFKSKIAKNLLRDSWPNMIAGVMITLYMKIDQVMINGLLNTKEVGIYSAAVRISEAWYFIPMVLSSSLAPSIISSKLDGDKYYLKRLSQIYKLSFLISILIVIPVIILSDEIILLLYGNEYFESINILIVHILTSLFVFIGPLNGLRLLNEDLLNYGPLISLTGLIVNITLNYFFIVNYGIIGASLSTFISHFFSDYFSYVFFKKTRHIFYFINKVMFSIFYKPFSSN